MTVVSVWKAPKKDKSLLKMLCKNEAKRGLNTKYTKYASNSQRPSMRHGEGVKIRPFSVLIRVQKQKLNVLTNHAKMGTKEGFNGK